MLSWTGPSAQPAREGCPDYLGALRPDTRVPWLCGVVGSVKSSIVISVAKLLHQMGLLGSLYGFQAANQATLNPTNLFSTIARHLADRNPARKQRLLNVIRQCDPIKRATSSPAEQFEEFVLTQAMEDTITIPLVVIIEALDESGDVKSRRDVLDTLERCAHELPPGIRLIITSRLEHDVQRVLKIISDKNSLLMMEHIPAEDTRQDIHAYVHYMLKGVDALNSERYVPRIAALAITTEESF